MQTSCAAAVAADVGAQSYALSSHQVANCSTQTSPSLFYIRTFTMYPHILYIFNMNAHLESLRDVCSIVTLFKC